MSALTHHQMNELRQALEAREAALRQEILEELKASSESRWSDLAGSVHDFGDESVADQLSDLDSAMVNRHLQELRAIALARQRMAGGSYGECGDCGGAIGFARLKAYPTAGRCVACQGQREKTFGHEDTPTL